MDTYRYIDESQARTTHTGPYGTSYVGPSQGNKTRIDLFVGIDGDREYSHVFTDGRDDVSDTHSTYPTGYNPRCNLCWLNFNHTEQCHAAELLEHADK